MNSIGVLIDERFRRHATGAGHPETPARLDVIASALESSGVMDACEPLAGEPVSEAHMQTVHGHDYLTRLDSACRQGVPYLDAADTPICPESFEIAKLAAGGVVHAARLVARGTLKRAFCAVRPPGHHAEANRSMGFCLLNNVAIAAYVLKEEFGLTRLLIVDFDVHHCNGTQHAFEADPSVLVISLHGHPNYLFPGTGREEEVGIGPGVGYTTNIPLEPGATDDDYRAAFDGRIKPAVARYAPQFILVSAGFDAHRDDELGNLSTTDEIYSWMTTALVKMADQHAGGRLVSVLEGGYNHDVLQRCVPEHVRLLGAR